MRILLFGASGQLGLTLRAQAAGALQLVLPANGRLDVTSREAVMRAIADAAPDAVLNASAYTAVDKAETEPDLAFAVNRDGPGFIAEACARLDIPLLHISTDYVFDGEKSGPYVESDPVRPLGVYGASKLAGEEQIRSRCERHIILRTSWVYGPYRTNFVKTILKRALGGTTLRVVDDQRGCPTSTPELASALLHIASRMHEAPKAGWGLFHFSGATPLTGVSWYELACAAVGFIGDGKNYPVLPVSTSEFPTPAKRPRNGVLCTEKISQVWGIHPRDWQDALAHAFPEILRSVR